MTKRWMLASATVALGFLLATMDIGHAQNRKNSCANMCGCHDMMCIDFCSPSACGNSACRRRFDRLVRDCNRACKQCTSLLRRKTK